MFAEQIAGTILVIIGVLLIGCKKSEKGIKILGELVSIFYFAALNILAPLHVYRPRRRRQTLPRWRNW